MIFLTVNDAPSGVYKSQVVEVIEEINKIGNSPITLISFISIRNFKSQKSKIKLWYPNAKVIPMVPKLKLWYTNRWMLKLLFFSKKNETCIARNVMAYAIAKNTFKKIIYDGRGAISAELVEYPDMIPDSKIVQDIIKWEKKAVIESFYKIAVSNQLVEYWKKKFNYTGNNHFVIPCTVNSNSKPTISPNKILAEFGWNDDDIIILYSGGIAGWQSFTLLENILENWIINQNVKILFLTQPHQTINKLMDQFPNEVKRKWLKPEEVTTYTQIADYGLLIREDNVTNQVASPVKFSEYLNSGLKIIISEKIGDFSDFVKTNNCGHLINDKFLPGKIKLSKTTKTTKSELIALAQKHFSKNVYKSSFKQLLKL